MKYRERWRERERNCERWREIERERGRERERPIKPVRLRRCIGVIRIADVIRCRGREGGVCSCDGATGMGGL